MIVHFVEIGGTDDHFNVSFHNTRISDEKCGELRGVILIFCHVILQVHC